MGKKLNIIGKKFNRLTVVGEFEERSSAGKVRFLCKCDCGKEVVVIGSKLINGWTKSCACLQREKVKITGKLATTHGGSRTSLYSIWASMKSRCYRSDNESYKDYGGRGVTVCDRWINSFENFKKDMGERPSSKHSIDRINNDGNYEPKNCRWATRVEQERNKRKTVLYPFNGNMMTIAEISRATNIRPSVLYGRISRRGQDPDVIAKKYEGK